MKKTKRVLAHRKHELDMKVSLLLGMEKSTVSAVTSEFLRQTVSKLVELEEVRLDGLGTLKLTVRKGCGNGVLKAGRLRPGSPPVEVKVHRSYHVSVKKAEPFKAAIVARHGSFVTVEPTMEKYGVDEGGEELEKRAAHGCPICGAKPEKHGNILACPKHGTEPFENKKG